MRSSLESIARGAFAGAAGGLALTAGEPLERVVLGREPVYAPSRILSELFASRAPSRLGTRLASTVSLRFGYAMGLGAAYGAARHRLPKPPPLGGIVLGAAICAFEIVAMPTVGATPRIRAWPRGDLALLAVHTLGFGLASAFVYERLKSVRERRPHSSLPPAPSAPS